MKQYIRYIATEKFRENSRKILRNNDILNDIDGQFSDSNSIMYLEKIPPAVPHVKVVVTIEEIEPLYDYERKFFARQREIAEEVSHEPATIYNQ